MKQVLILLYATATMVAGLLTHQAITKRLEEIPNKLREKQDKWCKENEHNDLVFLKNHRESNLHSLIEYRLKNYLNEYNAKTANVGIRVVSVARIGHAGYYREKKVQELLFLASELLKSCKASGQERVFERYSYRFECWKFSANTGYSKLANKSNDSYLIYIEGSKPNYDFYSNYVAFYLRCNVMVKSFCPSMVIALQKDEKMRTFDIKTICNELHFENCNDLILNIGKIKNFNSLTQLKNTNLAQTASLYMEKKRKHIKEVTHIYNYADNPYSLLTTIRYFDEAQTNPKKYKPKEILHYPILNCHKMIKQNSLMIRKSYDRIDMEIKFTYFLINNENLSSKSYKYEILVMVMVLYGSEHLHVSAYKYPVTDKSGNHPIVDFDENLPYYKKMMEHSNKTGHILDTLYQTYVNGSGYSYENLTDFINIFQIKDRCFYDISFEDQVYEFDQWKNTYHKKNNEFIAHLKDSFGKNVSIRLFDVCLRSNPGLKRCRYYRREPDLIIDAIYNKEISLEEYKNYGEDNLSSILMLITITDDPGTQFSYSFLQCRDYNWAEKLLNNLQNSKYRFEVSNFIYETITKLAFDEDFLEKAQITKYKTISNHSEIIEYCLLEIGSTINNITKNDLYKFLIFDAVYIQKALFLSIQKIPPVVLKLLKKINLKHSFDTKELFRKMKVVIQKEGSSLEDKKQIQFDIDFVSAQIEHIRDLKHFEDFFRENDDATAKNVLRNIVYEVLKRSRAKSYAKFVADAVHTAKERTYLYLQHNDFVIAKETTEKIYIVIDKTFKIKDDFDGKRKSENLSTSVKRTRMR